MRKRKLIGRKMPEKKTLEGERRNSGRKREMEKKEGGRTVDTGKARRMGYGTRHTPS